MTTKVALIYPYFHPSNDNSIFRFPPLGLGYIAGALKRKGAEVNLIDCTFLTFNQALNRIKQFEPQIVGFYSMFSMKKTTIQLAQAIKQECKKCLFVVGGPLPSWAPESFLEEFDIVAIGEGEQTMTELVEHFDNNADYSTVKGLMYKTVKGVINTGNRDFVENLDSLTYPTRELFDNKAYKRYYQNRFGYSTTSMITSRGCPFSCDFCSRPIFGSDIRSRSVKNIVDEVETIAKLGYDRVWFADDCFTLNSQHLLEVCNEITRRKLKVGWECLSRVDTMDTKVAKAMKEAGCIRIFFGIESGNDHILDLMNKHITTKQAKKAVETAKSAGLRVGAFFIIGYPGEDEKTILDTIKFASELPLDYLSFTLPYPIPGTPLYERVKTEGVSIEDWEEPKNYRLIRHKLIYQNGFSETKLKFAIGKAQAQFYGRKYLGKTLYNVFGKPLEYLTDFIFKQIN